MKAGPLGSSPILNPVAAMRLTIVRYASSTCFSNFAKLSPEMNAGFACPLDFAESALHPIGITAVLISAAA